MDKEQKKASDTSLEQSWNDLRTALAINRGMHLIHEMTISPRTHIPRNTEQLIQNFEHTFLNIHNNLFQDWHHSPVGSTPPGEIVGNKKQDFHDIIKSLVSDEDTAIFSRHGFLIKAEDVPEKLALFYKKMRKLEPFGYGNELTLNFFMVLMSKMQYFESVYPNGIDFRRLPIEDDRALHDKNSSMDSLTRAFRNALDPSNYTGLHNHFDDHTRLPENKKEIGRLSFIYHKTDYDWSYVSREGTPLQLPSNIECLVTVTGGLVPLNKVKACVNGHEISLKHLREKDYAHCITLSDIMPDIRENQIIGYLNNTEILRLPGKKHIDGIAVAQDSAPLACLSVDLMTGLLPDSNAKFMGLLNKVTQEKRDFFSGLKNPPLLPILDIGIKAVMLKEAEKMPLPEKKEMQNIIDMAYTHLEQVSQLLEGWKDDVLSARVAPADGKDRIVVCIGGSGTGKEGLKQMVRTQYGNQFIEIGYDSFREKSDIYHLLRASNNHNDDYTITRSMVDELMSMVLKESHAHGVINSIYDKTLHDPAILEGVPHTSYNEVMLIDTPIEKAISRINKRFKTENKIVSLSTAIAKHVEMPNSFLTSIQDSKIDKCSFFDNSRDDTEPYLVAETFDFRNRSVASSTLGKLRKSYDTCTLAKYLEQLIREQETSKLRNMADSKTQGTANINELLTRNPNFREGNVAYQVYEVEGTTRVLAIYDLKRFTAFMEKAQLNQYAASMPLLRHRKPELSWVERHETRSISGLSRGSKLSGAAVSGHPTR